MFCALLLLVFILLKDIAEIFHVKVYLYNILNIYKYI